MIDWSPSDFDSTIKHPNNQFANYHTSYKKAMQAPQLQFQSTHTMAQTQPSTSEMSNSGENNQPSAQPSAALAGETSRLNRNRAEKMRRDKMNQSIAQLASIVPPVLAAGRKLDKSTILRLSAHYLRSHQHVFGNSVGHASHGFSPASILSLMGLFNGFLITVTYRGIIVVVSKNVQKFLGYSEVDLLGLNLVNMIHPDDRSLLLEQLMPKSQTFGPTGELLIPDEPGAVAKVEQALAREKRNFVIRFKKLGHRSQSSQYLTCHVEGSMRKSDNASGILNPCAQIRRVRARTENPWSSGNDVVFVAMVRPSTETFMNEVTLLNNYMEYRTRHFIDGQIIESDSRISLVTGYMTQEVYGVNAMNFMHRDDVRWVAIALRDMFDQHRLHGESCYRLMTKTGHFVHMKTCGHLVVDEATRSCTTFVCTNTVVDEEEGKYLIEEMKKKFSLLVHKYEPLMLPANGETNDVNNGNQETVENPGILQVVILYLVTDMPFLAPNNNGSSLAQKGSVPPRDRVSLLSRHREHIVRGIDRVRDVIRASDVNQNASTSQQNNHATTCSNQRALPFSYDNSQPSTSREDIVVASSSTSMYPRSIHETYYTEQASSSQSHTTMFLPEDEDIANLNPTINSIISSDLELCDEWSVASSLVFENTDDILQNIEYEGQELQAIYHDTESETNMLPLHSITEKANSSQMTSTLPQPSTSQLSSQNQTTSNFDGEILKHKRKIKDTPKLENYFEETLVGAQIESAINSLHEIDCNLLELDSTDIEQILEQIEEN